MGMFSPAWQDKDRDKALAAIEKLSSDGQLFRAARDANDEIVALAAAVRINDELLLEQLALSLPRVNNRVAGFALQKIAAWPNDFRAMLQRLEDEADAGGAQRVNELLGAAMDAADDPAVFAKMLATLAQDARCCYLKDCDKNTDYLAGVLRQLVGIFAHQINDMAGVIGCFSDAVILKTTELIDETDRIMGEVVPVVVGGFRTQEARLAAVNSAVLSIVRVMALARIDDQKELFDIAMCNDRCGIRQTAAKRLEDNAAVVQYLAAHPEDATESLLSRITRRENTATKKKGRKKEAPAPAAPDSEFWLAVALNSADENARKKAAAHLTEAGDINQYARCHPEDMDKEFVPRVTSQPLLLDMACGKFHNAKPVLLAAIQCLNNDEGLGKVVQAHTQRYATSEQHEFAEAALKRMQNQEIIYQAARLADGVQTSIGSYVIDYITDKALLLRIALGDRFSKEAAEKISDVFDLKQIVKKTAPDSAAHRVAYRKLEDIRICALADADEDARQDAVLTDESDRVRVAAITLVNDQKFLGDMARNGQTFHIRTAAIERISDWKILFSLIGDNGFSYVLKRLKSEEFAQEREAIVAAAAEKLMSSDRRVELNAKSIIVSQTEYKENEALIKYGGEAYIKRVIERLLGNKEMAYFREAYEFLRYAYKQCESCRDALFGIGKKTVARHVDFVSSCASESCDVTVDVTIDFEDI